MNTVTKIAVLLSFSLCAAASAQSTVLFEDDFSSYAIGADSNAITGSNGKWVKAGSVPATNFVIVADPNNLGEKLLWSTPSTSVAGTFARVASKENFELDTGLKIDFTLNTTFTTDNNVQYNRIGLVDPSNPTTSGTYLDIGRTFVRVGGVELAWGADGMPSFSQGATHNFTWEFVRLGSGVQMSLVMDGELLFKGSYTDGFDLDQELKLLVGYRNDTVDRKISSYFGDVSVSRSAIPEPASVAAVLAALGLGACLILRRRKAA